MKKLTKVLLVAAVAAAATSPALATQDLSDITTNLSKQLPGVASLMGIGAYIAAIGFGIKAAKGFMDYNQSKGQQVPLSTPLMAAAVSAMLFALPSLIGGGAATIFGKGNAQKTSLEGGGTIRNIQ